MTYYKTGNCSAESLWDNAEELIKETPRGYVLDGDLKHPFFAITSDPLCVPGCQIALEKFLDGSPVAVRWPVTDFVIANMCPKCYRDLDFIQRVLGPEGVVLHQRAHEQEHMVERLKAIRGDCNDPVTKEALTNLIKDYE